MTVEFVPVAHKNHLLHQQNSPLNFQDLAQHRQIVIHDSAQKSNLDSGWLGAEQRWTVSHISTSVDMIRKGLGFAWLPRHRVDEYLDSGELRELPLESKTSRQVTVNIVYADKDRAGPATQALAGLFVEESPGSS